MSAPPTRQCADGLVHATVATITLRRICQRWLMRPPLSAFPVQLDAPVPMGRFAELYRVLEIAVSHGGSLELWRAHFGPTAVIFGIDVESRSPDAHDASVEARIGSQQDPAFLRAVVEDGHTSYWARYGGGIRRQGIFIEAAKSIEKGSRARPQFVPIGRTSF